ncbi:MAG: proton-conducting transporter transmembrane domain-containing protein, partial [Anaerolineae bacterium]
PGGSAALLVYLLTYAVTNLGAFAVVQVVEERAGSDDIKAYSGLGQRAPGLAAALVFFFLSLVGIPPMACFLGKLFVFGAAINAGAYWLAAVGVANSVISLAYYFRVVRVMYFEAPGEAAAAGAVPVNLRLAVAVSWAGTLGLIALAAPVIAWAENAVVRLLP